MQNRLLIALFLVSSYAQAQDVTALVREAVTSLQNPQNGIQQYRMPAFQVQISFSNEVNAFADATKHTIYINAILVKILARDPGELAFVIAHEIGHIQDAECPERTAKLGYRGLAAKRICESAADQIGMQYILAGGFSPFDAAGLMGRLLMAYPGQNSVIAIVMGRFMSDHPVDIDRIKQLSQYARTACQERPEICVR